MPKISRMNALIVCEALLTVTVTLGILAYFSHKAIHKEAMNNAEQMLEATVQDIDNILLSVEQTTGNVYYDMLQHLDNPSRMYTYSREIVASNQNIVGCAIAFKPGYYPGKNLFMAYVHRKEPGKIGNTELITSDTFTDHPYTQQAWFANHIETGRIAWIDPLKGDETEDEPLVCFSLPFSDSKNQRAGVIAVFVSINQLSKIILAAKPSANGYAVLLANNGSYIVHTDKEKLQSPVIFSQLESNADHREIEAAEDMLLGKSGMKEFTRDGKDWCVFFRPFERIDMEGRSSGKIGWSVGLVYPEEDVFGSHNTLLFMVIAIAIVGLLLFFMICSLVIRRQLKPLRLISSSARQMAAGNYDHMLHTIDRQDEIGLLHNRFAKMQRSLHRQVDKLEGDISQLQHTGDMIKAANEKAVETDAMKTSFLQYITSQMFSPTESIDNNVTKLCNQYHDLSKEEIKNHVDKIHEKSNTMLELLDQMAHFATTDHGKEASHD